MKWFKLLLMTMVVAVVASSCSKDGAGKITGTYTYKTSGTVTLMATSLVGLDQATLAAYKASGVNVDPVTVGLYPEQGQMNVLRDGDNYMVTFNDLLGGAAVSSADIDGDTIKFDGSAIKSAQLTDGKDKLGAGVVMFGGEGRKIDDVIIFKLNYQGAFTLNGIPMTVVSSNVDCVAKKN